MNVKFLIECILGAVALAAGLIGMLSAGRAKEGPDEAALKKQKKRKKLFLILMILGAWVMLGAVLTQISGMKHKLEIEFSMFSERVPVFGITLAKTTITACVIIAGLAVLLLLFRIFCVPRFSVDEPGRFQSAMEVIVEFMDNFVRNSVGEMPVRQLSPFMLSVGLCILGCETAEFFAVRPPTADLTFTFALGLSTFALLNIYGIKKNGIGGRLKNMGGPIPAMRPLMVPLKAVSDVAVPISLACRLFGNMMGGMLVMDMLKGALGGFGTGLPPVLGLYFYLGHPLLQIYIFITLSLIYINEAME